MYYHAPGHQHIKLFVPDLTPPKPHRGSNPSPGRRTQVAPLLRHALDAAFGLREPGGLSGAHADLSVRSHIRARRRAHAPAAKLSVLTCYTRGAGEIYGTVKAGQKIYAYAARLKHGRLVSFRVL